MLERERERARENNCTFDTNYHKMSLTKRKRLQNESKGSPQRFSDNLALSDSHHVDWSVEGLCVLLVCCPANIPQNKRMSSMKYWSRRFSSTFKGGGRGEEKGGEKGGGRRSGREEGREEERRKGRGERGGKRGRRRGLTYQSAARLQAW